MLSTNYYMYITAGHATQTIKRGNKKQTMGRCTKNRGLVYTRRFTRTRKTVRTLK